MKKIASYEYLVWLTLPFYDFCSFWSFAVNRVYKLQYLSLYLLFYYQFWVGLLGY